jgi:uncharacterized protein YceK
MNSKLFDRRRRTLILLASCNGVSSVVTAISSQFGCSEAAVRKDLKNIHRWGKYFIDLDYSSIVITSKFNLLDRDALDTLLSCKEERFKHQARVDALSIVKEKVKLGLRLGYIDSVPREVNQTLSVRLPFEADSEIMEVYRRSAERQRAERHSSQGVGGKDEAGIEQKGTDEKPAA